MTGRQAHDDAKYPGRKNKKNISMDMLGEEGWSTSLGCSVSTTYKPKKYVVAPGPRKCWRITLGDEGLGCWTDLGMEDWVQSPEVEKKRKVSRQVMRTLTAFAPSELCLEKWKQQLIKNKCEEFDLHSDEEGSLATKQDEHDRAQSDEEAEV